MANGTHTISANAYDSNQMQIGSSSVTVNVANGTASNALYVSSSTGNDSNPGTQSQPLKTIAKVISLESSLTPGEQVLFKAGDVWQEELTLDNVNGSAGNRIIFGSYGGSNGNNYPIIDGNNGAIDNCICADQETNNSCGQSTQGRVSYVTVTGFECQNTSQYGITFIAYNSPMPGIVVSNNYIHNTGPGAYAGGSGGYDDGNFRNQLNMEDDHTTAGDGFQVLNNIVNSSGGHNCLAVQGDFNGPVVSGNIVGPGCVHNLIDLESTSNALIENNVSTCPNCNSNSAIGIFIGDQYGPSSATLVANTAYSIPVGVQAEPDTSINNYCKSRFQNDGCSLSLKVYNETTYGTTLSDVESSQCSVSQAPITLDIQKSIFDGGVIDIESTQCIANWNYNDDLNISGNPTGPQDLSNVDPQFMDPTNGNFTPQHSTIITGGENDPLSPYDLLGYLGAVE